MATLSQLNSSIEAREACLSEPLWRRWLWECDMHAPLSPKFNESHLLGLLLARQKAIVDPVDVRLAELLPSMIHGPKRTSELTLRQLRDALEDLQMHWPEHCKHGDSVVDVLDALWTRFGMINLQENCCLDDLSSLDPDCPTRMSNAALRRFTVIFCVLYRHLDLESSCTHVADPPADLPDLQSYHRQAGLDAFHEHAMYADLPPAARITYKQDFAGMYHSITQVLYFHFPDYARQRQISLEDMRGGLSHLHCLSVALELRPDIQVRVEDEQWQKGWNWLLLPGGKVYLASAQHGVFTAPSIWRLLELASEPSN